MRQFRFGRGHAGRHGDEEGAPSDAGTTEVPAPVEPPLPLPPPEDAPIAALSPPKPTEPAPPAPGPAAAAEASPPPGADPAPTVSRPRLAALAPSPPVLSSPDQVPAAIVDALDTFLEPVDDLPAPVVAVLQLTPRSLGIGGLRGLGRAGTFAVEELRGGHVEAIVRFQVWGDGPDGANEQMLALQGRLFAAQPGLFAAGFLEMGGTAGTLAEEEGEAWARTGDYRVLFEYHLAPASDTQSLVASIPIRTDQAVDGGIVTETTTVTDDLVRWDNELAPPLVLRGTRSVDSLATLSFVPATVPSGAVRMLRTHDDAAGPPRDFTTLPDFLAALGDPVSPETHGRLSLASLDAFLSGFTPAGGLLPMGDWDEDGSTDGYQAARLELAPQVVLPTAQDRFEISLESSPFDQVGVVYLRAAGSLV